MERCACILLPEPISYVAARSLHYLQSGAAGQFGMIRYDLLATFTVYLSAQLQNHMVMSLKIHTYIIAWIVRVERSVFFTITVYPRK